ncbi:seminal metalloprotease 1-like [Drosophila tropicalis]|uniref:seminal metalloprotease 1-like n=1 Tax=Drosophila tropicalis TaxID=46794 RepID=UPI0035ABDE53
MVCCLFPWVSAAPTNPLKEVEDDPELTAGYFEGDMELDGDINSRNGLRDDANRWPNATIPYKIDPEFADPFVAYIKLAMMRIELVSCIQFVAAADDAEDYVLILPSTTGCSSNVGYLPGERTVKLKPGELDKGCFRLASIQHELLHTMGFHHQQSSHDRDNYVLIVEENIRDGYAHNFRKYESEVIENFDQSYDYASVLHYSSLAYSNNGEPTIVALNAEGQSKMGQRLQMTATDINRLNVMYKCPLQM